ncbi:MAG: class I SAM-dependent methyltransferase [Lapillicoccus sp.]
MAFDVAGEMYQRFMGRFSDPLAEPFADFARVGHGSGMRVLDVGCGPGALSVELVQRVGVHRVTAVDPSEPFVTAARERLPGVDVQRAGAEELPFADASFDAVLAQLVVQFMTDPAVGVAEMARVAKPGGVVAACVWDHGGRRGPLSPFWTAAAALDPAAPNEDRRVGAQEGDLEDLLRRAGLRDVTETGLTVTKHFATFEEWWEPFTFGVGPAGDYARTLDERGLAALREQCRAVLPPEPFDLDATAWAARGTGPAE